VQLRVLGPVQVRGPLGPIELTRAKERAVLAALALFHGRAVSTDRLVDAVWAGGPPVRADKALQIHVQRLRARLGSGVIETRSDGYALAGDVLVDAELFETAAKDEHFRTRLRGVLARWSGEPYVDLGEWPPAEMERARLAEVRDHALETCLALELEAGRSAECIAELEVMVADKPLRERRWFLLMTAMYRDGRVADALRAYQRARKVFAAELGIDPGPELRALEEEILLADVRETWHGNLPRQLRSFVGRELELAQLASAVRERPLVTLTGAGGVGKTRLALETAAAVSADFPDGTWLCELAPLSDPEALWETLAASLRVRRAPGQNLRDVVLRYLALKRLLLILDNCEHLVVTVGNAVEAITQTCPTTAVLATSRERLAVPGEHTIALLPFVVPPTDANIEALAQSDAARLFCDRASDANSAFSLSDHNRVAVAQLCQQLDGIPLVIELAAARLRSMSPHDLVIRLDQRLTLTSDSRSAPMRHQTLRNAIDWSYDLLAEREQQTLNRMAVFAGGCDLRAPEAVVAGNDIEQSEVAGLLNELVNKSLVEIDVSDESWRYGMLETIRQYAHERLDATGETARLRDRHLARYVCLADEAGPHLRGRDQLEWATVVARDTDNLRAALEWAAEAGHVDEALRVVVSLAVTGLPTGWSTTDSAETAIDIEGASQHQLYPCVVALAATSAAMRVDLHRAGMLVASAQEAQRRLGTNYAEVHTAAGVLAMFEGDLAQARKHAEASVDHARATQDPFAITSALTLYATTLFPETDRATTVIEEAVHIARDAGIGSVLLTALTTLTTSIVHEHVERARALVNEMTVVANKLGDRWAIATATAYQAGVALVQQDWPRALRAATDAAERDLEVGGSAQLAATLAMAYMALDGLQLFEPAAVLEGLTEARFPPLAVDEQWHGAIAAANDRILDALGAPKTSELKARGAALTVAAAVTYLRSECDTALALEL
jgi:predicted ATPase/DNA-binding SARP family transcriptional activator